MKKFLSAETGIIKVDLNDVLILISNFNIIAELDIFQSKILCSLYGNDRRGPYWGDCTFNVQCCRTWQLAFQYSTLVGRKQIQFMIIQVCASVFPKRFTKSGDEES